MPYCAHCGNEISEAAVSCPRCGHPNEARAGATTAVAGVAPAEYAGFWRRLLARLLDGILLMIPSALLGGGFVSADGSQMYFTNPLSTVIGFIYEWLMIAFNNGQTVGKMALGIRITRPDGQPVDLGHAAARAGMAIVSGLALLLGYLWAAWDPEKRTWHDMVADTRAYRSTR